MLDLKFYYITHCQENLVLPPGFEPGCSAREAEMMGRTTLQELNFQFYSEFLLSHSAVFFIAFRLVY